MFRGDEIAAPWRIASDRRVAGREEGDRISMAGFVNPSRRSIVADNRSDTSNEVQRSRPISMPPHDVDNDLYRDERRRKDNRQAIAGNHMRTLVTPNGIDGAHDLPSKPCRPSERPEPGSRPKSVPSSTDPRRRPTITKPLQDDSNGTITNQHTTKRPASPRAIGNAQSMDPLKTDWSSTESLNTALVRLGEFTYDKRLDTLKVAQQSKDLVEVQQELQMHTKTSRQHAALVEVLEGKIQAGNKKLDSLQRDLSASQIKTGDQAESVVQKILALVVTQVETQVNDAKDQSSLAKSDTQSSPPLDLSAFIKTETLETRLEEQNTKLRLELETLQNLYKSEIVSMKAEAQSTKTTHSDTKSAIETLQGELESMRSEREAHKSDIDYLKTEIESMKTERAEQAKHAASQTPDLSLYIEQYKTFGNEMNKRIAEMKEKQECDHAAAGTRLEQLHSHQLAITSDIQDLQSHREERKTPILKPPSLSEADATLLRTAAAYGPRIGELEEKLTLNSKRLDTETASVHEASELSKKAKQLSDANQHSIQSLNARYNNLNTEELARYMARVLQPLPASIQADHTVLQRNNAELSVKIEGLQRKVDEEHSQLQQLRSSVSTLEERDHGASLHGNVAFEELAQEVQRLTGLIDQHHMRQDLILRVITDGKAFDHDGSASADLVTQESLSQQVQASILRVAGPRLDSQETRIQLSQAAADRFHEMMDEEIALQKEQIEGSVKDTVQDKVDFVAVQLTEQVDASVSRAMSEGQYPTITQLHAHETDVRELKEVLKGWVESFERKRGKSKASGAPGHSASLAQDREPGSALRSPNLDFPRQANMTGNQVAKLNTPSSTSTSFDELQHEVSTLQDKVGDLVSDLEDVKGQLAEVNRRVMLDVFGGDIKSSAKTISPPLLQETVTRGGSKLASTLDVSATTVRTVPSTKPDLETLDTKCSVKLEDGNHCRRNLSGKIHNNTAKRAVHGCSQPFDRLREAWLDRGGPAIATMPATAESARNSTSTGPRQPSNSHNVSDTENRWTSSNSSPVSDARSGPTGQNSTRKRQMWDLSTSESDSDDTSTIEVSSKQRPSKRFKGA